MPSMRQYTRYTPGTANRLGSSIPAHGAFQADNYPSRHYNVPTRSSSRPLLRGIASLFPLADNTGRLHCRRSSSIGNLPGNIPRFERRRRCRRARSRWNPADSSCRRNLPALVGSRCHHCRAGLRDSRCCRNGARSDSIGRLFLSRWDLSLPGSTFPRVYSRLCRGQSRRFHKERRRSGNSCYRDRSKSPRKPSRCHNNRCLRR
jgi:hypothetical protein